MPTYATRHDGRYISGYSVVVARNEEEARRLIDALLVERGLEPHAEYPYELIRVKQGQAVMLSDGDY
jgi:hypothetical protein